MKTRIIIFLSIISFSFLQIYAQECISSFTSELQKQVQNLKKNEKRSIEKFMRVGYKAHPEYQLQDSNVIAKPIYSIFKKNIILRR